MCLLPFMDAADNKTVGCQVRKGRFTLGHAERGSRKRTSKRKDKSAQRKRDNIMGEKNIIICIIDQSRHTSSLG